MKKLLSFILFLLTASPLLAEYSQHDTGSGIVLLSKNPGSSFTLDIDGEQISPVKSDPALQICFMVDGRFLQVMPVPLAEFDGNPKAPDEEVLRAYLKAMSEFYKQPLSDFHIEKTILADSDTALITSFTPKYSQNPREQISILYRFGDNIMVLGSVLAGTDTKPAILKFLTRIANSFVSSTSQLTIEMQPNGTYKRIKE